MRAMVLKSRLGQAAGVLLGMGALLSTSACGGPRDLSAGSPQQLAGNPAGTPVVVGCEPHQRTLVRPALVNGAAVSQVECVTAAQVNGINGYAPAVPVAHAQPADALAPPVTYAPQHVSSSARRRPQPVYSDLGDAQIVPARTGGARPVRTSQVIYDERPVKKSRSVQKSAIIIGSSAGAGAGVGAAMGGKKGALIGAAIGGGGAAVWDQITRRK